MISSHENRSRTLPQRISGVTKEILLAGLIAFALPGVMIMLLVLLTACPFVSESVGEGDEPNGPGVAGVDVDCTIVPCTRPSEDDGTEAGEASGSEGPDDEEDGSESVGSEDPAASSSESSGSSGTETGEPELDPYGPCGTCEGGSFTSQSGSCACAPFCLSVEDCPDAEETGAECIAGAGCFVPCGVDGSCPDGMVCAPWQYSITHGDACFWS